MAREGFSFFAFLAPRVEKLKRKYAAANAASATPPQIALLARYTPVIGSTIVLRSDAVQYRVSWNKAPSPYGSRSATMSSFSGRLKMPLSTT